MNALLSFRSAAALLIAVLGLGLSACDEVAALDGPTHQYILQADVEELAASENGAEKVNEAMASTMDVISRRIGNGESIIHRIEHQGAGRIILEVSGPIAGEDITQVLGLGGELEFRMVDTTAKLEDTLKGIAPPGSEVLPMADGSGSMALRRIEGIKGRHITDAIPGIDESTDRSVVNIRLDETGKTKLTALTTQHIGQPMAIVLDGEVLSAPIIQEPIVGGALQVSGGFTAESANLLSIKLKSGALPTNIRLLQERELD